MALALGLASPAPAGEPTERTGLTEDGRCAAWDVTYAAVGNLQLSDTPMGAANGTYPVGPGKIVLRQDARSGRVALLAFELPERLGIESTRVFWTTHVDMDATARAPASTPDACNPAAEGAMQGRRIVWSTRLRGFRTDGTLVCRGSMCGKFGAPPAGSSPLVIGPHDVELQPFEFGGDGRTFTMASAFVSKTDSPKQTAHLSISARETRRVCAPVATCP
jgi:hypothetical protein